MRRSLRIAFAAVALLIVAGCGRSHSPEAAQANLLAGQAFLASNAKVPGVHVLADGLQYKILASGPADGLRPHPQDEVKVNYEGRLINGQVFDSSFERCQPAAFPLDQVIPGWTEGLQLMRPGDEWLLYVPPKLGYGDEEKGDKIPANSVLIFRVQLIGVLPHPGSIQAG
jgi:peptidylprolyl isomerase/FKBP-type peptidyl-prolyl cis-trans isomerase FklB